MRKRNTGSGRGQKGRYVLDGRLDRAHVRLGSDTRKSDDNGWRFGLGCSDANLKDSCSSDTGIRTSHTRN
ncbi:hypothetical protein RJT34_16046 [Clitoria ternatea]|uniref:Uncharacterized protein n=1 Tax=Clitoria ternatea TaxID=43366 RepID=A0AAN9J9H9_CLITE